MILVDPIQEHETRLRAGRFWCHMVSDVGADELHEFAGRLGLKRAWSQERPKSSAHHYDITPPRRARALVLGAVEVTGRELVLRNYDGLTRRRERGELPRVPCGKYLGDNDATTPQLTCVRWRHHDGLCDNVRGDE